MVERYGVEMTVPDGMTGLCASGAATDRSIWSSAGQSGGHTDVAIRTTPPATNAPPTTTPRDRVRGDSIRAITHTLMPTTMRIVPTILRGRAVLRNLSATKRRLRILNPMAQAGTMLGGRR